MISDQISLAVKLLIEGEVIGFPTETVYGLAGNIYDKNAIDSIYQIKQRPSFNPLIVHIKNRDELSKVAINIPEKASVLAEAFWPGSLTLLLPKHPSVPLQITAGKDTVAVRIPNHPVALALLAQLDFPLAAPSANPFSRISPTTAEQVDDYFKEQIPMVLKGGTCSKGVESTIIGFDNNQVILYRYGAIPAEAIEALVGELYVYVHNEQNPEAPGMLTKHYSPLTSIHISENIAVDLQKNIDKKVGLLLYSQSNNNIPATCQKVLSVRGDLNEAAANLYQALNDLDKLKLDIIIAEKFPDEGLGKTINDRLNRASK